MPQAECNRRAQAGVRDPPNVRCDHLSGYPDVVNRTENGELARYHIFGILALDGRICQYLSAPKHPFDEPGPRFVGAKLIYSPDNGRTWHSRDGTTPVRNSAGLM